MSPTASLAVILGLLALSGASSAADTREQECGIAKLRAAGSEVRARLVCEARGLVADDAASCIAAAAARRDRAVRHAEHRGGCNTTGDSASIGSNVDFAVRSQILGFVRPREPTTASCAQRLLGLAARTALRTTQIYAALPRSGEARFDAQLAAARRSFDAALRRAEAIGCAFDDPFDGTYAYTAVTTSISGLRQILCPDCGVLCPCWTTTSLDATFTPAVFAERGGIGCLDAGDALGFASADSCYDPRTGAVPVAGVFFAPGTCATFLGAGCWPQISFHSIRPEEEAVCAAALRRSAVFRQQCDVPR